jgi:hypothetical protein
MRLSISRRENGFGEEDIGIRSIYAGRVVSLAEKPDIVSG